MHFYRKKNIIGEPTLFVHDCSTFIFLSTLKKILQNKIKKKCLHNMENVEIMSRFVSPTYAQTPCKLIFPEKYFLLKIMSLILKGMKLFGPRNDLKFFIVYS